MGSFAPVIAALLFLAATLRLVAALPATAGLPLREADFEPFPAIPGVWVPSAVQAAEFSKEAHAATAAREAAEQARSRTLIALTEALRIDQANASRRRPDLPDLPLSLPPDVAESPLQEVPTAEVDMAEWVRAQEAGDEQRRSLGASAIESAKETHHERLQAELHVERQRAITELQMQRFQKLVSALDRTKQDTEARAEEDARVYLDVKQQLSARLVGQQRILNISRHKEELHAEIVEGIASASKEYASTAIAEARRATKAAHSETVTASTNRSLEGLGNDLDLLRQRADASTALSADAQQNALLSRMRAQAAKAAVVDLQKYKDCSETAENASASNAEILQAHATESLATADSDLESLERSKNDVVTSRGEMVPANEEATKQFQTVVNGISWTDTKLRSAIVAAHPEAFLTGVTSGIAVESKS